MGQGELGTWEQWPLRQRQLPPLLLGPAAEVPASKMKTKGSAVKLRMILRNKDGWVFHKLHVEGGSSFCVHVQNPMVFVGTFASSI